MNMFDLGLDGVIDRSEFETLAIAVSTNTIVWNTAGDIGGNNQVTQHTFTFNPDTLECKMFDGTNEVVVPNMECCSQNSNDSQFNGGACTYADVDANIHMALFTPCDTNNDGVLNYYETKYCYDNICAMIKMADPDSDCEAIQGEELAAYFDSNNDS